MKPSGQPELRVVLDTQVLLRGAVAKTDSLSAKIYDAWLSDRFSLLISDTILTEIQAVFQRPEVLDKLRFTPVEARAVIQLLKRRAHLITPHAQIRLCRDPADDKFLECAVTGAASYLVTADDDILSLGEIQGIPIINIPTFWRVLASSTPAER